MSFLGNVGYQLYNIKGGLLVVGPSETKSLAKSSKEDIEELLDTVVMEMTEDDMFIDHKINRGMLTDGG